MGGIGHMGCDGDAGMGAGALGLVALAVRGFSLRGRRFGARYASRRMGALMALGKAALAAAWRGRSMEWLTGGSALRGALAHAREDAEAAGVPKEALSGMPGDFPLRGEVVRAGRCSVEASMGTFLPRFGALSRRADREFCAAAAEALREIASKARQAKGR